MYRRVVLMVGLAFTIIVTASMSAPATDNFSEEECDYKVATAGLVNGLAMGCEAHFSATWWPVFLLLFISFLT